MARGEPFPKSKQPDRVHDERGAIDPLLGPLTNNGGLTATHLPQFGSLAIDAGDPAATPGVNGVPASDQRGIPYGRVVNLLEAENGPNNQLNVIDIGAIKVQLRAVPGQPGTYDPRITSPAITIATELLMRRTTQFGETIWAVSFCLAKRGPPIDSRRCYGRGLSILEDAFGATSGSGGGAVAFVLADFDHDQFVDDDDLLFGKRPMARRSISVQTPTEMALWISPTWRFLNL